MPGKRGTIADRFARYVERSACGCWNWNGAQDGHGYGHLNVRGKPIKAHRISYELNVGPIPEGLFILHSCDNRRCVNPAHLSVGDAADNSRDMAIKERSRTTVLTADDVRAIRQSNLSHAELGRKYGVTYQAIAYARSGATWAHI
jgi:hypothetical protein